MLKVSGLLILTQTKLTRERKSGDRRAPLVEGPRANPRRVNRAKQQNLRKKGTLIAQKTITILHRKKTTQFTFDEIEPYSNIWIN